MIKVETGKEKDCFVAYIEQALAKLSIEDDDAFLSLFDTSRLSKKDLILALRYLDETQPVMKIDDPTSTKNKQDIYLEAFDDSSGYFMDYDLMTDGELNDLTLQVEFIKKENGYFVVLNDLRTL
ncbi:MULTISPECIES: DUF7668 domain-containing protein [Bacillota]|jgi:hypothetical protein|uniref:DUF7668 domain-containing protein n=2 Tax=Amedibacillus TaxID=2749846 RepID=A0A7G9GRC6_9FIRM|nr:MULTISPECIES: hypothetical protein [Bacillota]QNM13358.1 hypothetical protein H9Q80_05240 [[Eubacterium] hominis]MCH4285568.1 hypothetical protein [Amedibacillus hominis]RGB50423.1 hypothetical protein DW271_16800 [Absiella sp. AM22-9]RGB58746.1 hypothetical protein DW120_13420 [Absiella sp. AM10-20]RGB64982.1 hypothetical protein DW113_13490 [Absiella sp. AM09-45]